MPLTVDGGNGLPKQMDEDSEFDDIELDVFALTAFTGGQATTRGNSSILTQWKRMTSHGWGHCPGMRSMRKVFQSAACRSD